MKPSSSDRIERLHSEVRAYVKQGLASEQIIEQMKAEQLEPYYIETIIGNVADEISNRKSFINSLIMGSVFILGGGITSYFSYNIAQNSGSSSFLLFWGIIVTGIVTIVRGFILYRK